MKLKEFSDLYPSDEKILWEENQVLMKDLKRIFPPLLRISRERVG
jgi:hypothetical protein